MNYTAAMSYLSMTSTNYWLNWTQNASLKLVLDLVDDKICKAFMAQPRDDTPLVIEVRKSTNSIPQGHDVLILMVH